VKRAFVSGAAVLLCAVLSAASAESKKIVLIAGAASHGTGEHEHPGGCRLLSACLNQVPGMAAEVHLNGWPQNPDTAFASAATVVLYSDGGGGNPFLQGRRLETIRQLTQKGVGLVCIHYAVEPTKEKGEAEFLDWIGGCFELDWSVNPTWTAEFKQIPEHPITRGVSSFKLADEWYFHMRFRERMKGVIPILSAVAPEQTMERADGPHEGNPAVRESVKKGEPQHLAWACERADGGRGFGFTGGHFYKNFANDNFRKVILNGILWTAKAEVPPNGVQCPVTVADLKQYTDRK
jgi:type 1 glutamine amidotransferase